MEQREPQPGADKGSREEEAPSEEEAMEQILVWELEKAEKREREDKLILVSLKVTDSVKYSTVPEST